MDLYQKKLASEKRKAFIEGFFINAFLLYYLFVCLLYLSFNLRGLELGDFAAAAQVGLVLLPIAVVIAGIWTRSPFSPGRTFIERTNDFLKPMRKEPDGSWWASPSGIVLIITLIATVLMGWSMIEVNLYSLFSAQGMAGAQRIFAALFSPEFDILAITLQAMVVTIFIALMATVIAVPLAFVLSFFSARNLMKGSAVRMAVYNVLRLIANFTRSIEPLIWAIIFSVWVGIGPFAGMLALMLHSVASLIKLYSEQIENVDQGPLEAIEATGANWIQVIWYAVVPQVALPFLSFTIYRWDINIRMATIIGLVGGGGIGTLLIQYQGLAKWNEVGTMVLTIAIVVWIMDYLSARIREAIY